MSGGQTPHNELIVPQLLCEPFKHFADADTRVRCDIFLAGWKKTSFYIKRSIATSRKMVKRQEHADDSPNEISVRFSF